MPGGRGTVEPHHPTPSFRGWPWRPPDRVSERAGLPGLPQGPGVGGRTGNCRLIRSQDFVELGPPC